MNIDLKLKIQNLRGAQCIPRISIVPHRPKEIEDLYNLYCPIFYTEIQGEIE